jgi:predicted nuclease of predicted toxin-antitoxin system
LENSSDSTIWEYAKSNQFTIVTFDSDFCDIANIKGSPPKIVWLRTGNMTTNHIADLLIKHQSAIADFIQLPEFDKIACLEIE